MTDLSFLRAELDGIDDAIHDLLMRRAAVVQRIGAQKSGPHWRPGREASILRRLVARHAGAYPAGALIRVWRELFAGSLAQQGHFAIAAPAALIETARAQFGLLAPLRATADPLAALRTGAAAVALMPMPHETEPWWRNLAGLHVVARLPFWPAPGAPAFAIAAAPPDPSGDDHTLLALHGDLQWPGATLLAQAEGWSLRDAPGWIAPDDPRLAALHPRARVIGAYATPVPVPLPVDE